MEKIRVMIRKASDDKFCWVDYIRKNTFFDYVANVSKCFNGNSVIVDTNSDIKNIDVEITIYDDYIE